MVIFTEHIEWYIPCYVVSLSLHCGMLHPEQLGLNWDGCSAAHVGPDHRDAATGVSVVSVRTLTSHISDHSSQATPKVGTHDREQWELSKLCTDLHVVLFICVICTHVYLVSKFFSCFNKWFLKRFFRFWQNHREIGG